MCSPSVIDSALAGLNRRDAACLAAALLAGAVTPGRSKADAGEKRTIPVGKVLDLTHPLSPTFPIWPGGVPIKVTNIGKVAKDGFYANRWEVVEHHGTHLDAPAHFAAEGVTAERVEASSLVVPAAVIDIRARVRKDVDALVTVDD